MRIWHIGATLAAWLAAAAMPGVTLAQDGFPNRPVHIVIPYSAGSVADVFGRIVAQHMAAQWNGSIVNEIKSGANGSIAAQEGARAAPDGYTWLLVTTFFSTSPSLCNNLRWDPALAQVQTGSIRIIGAISDGRSKYFPDVPTLAEQGFAEAQVTPWFGIVVTAGTPEPIVNRISQALEAALATADVREKLALAGCKPKSAPRAQFADIIKSDVALWAKVVKDAGITAD